MNDRYGYTRDARDVRWEKRDQRDLANDPEWIRADMVLLTALQLDPTGPEPSPALIAEAERIAAARARSGGLVETSVLDACERANIRFAICDAMTYRSGMANGLMVCLEPEPTQPTGERHAYVPRWVAPFFEATVSKSMQQRHVLKRAAAEPDFRAAGLSVWRLNGLEALVRWLDANA